MMIFKCKKFGGKVLPNTLYAVYYSDEDHTIPFVEKQNGVDEDYVNVRFALEKGQYGIFANEYHPGHVADAKKADLLLFVVDEPKRLCSSWILDIKVTVGGKDVISHLIEQWKASYKHKSTFSIYLDGFAETGVIGVITRDYQKDRIEAMVEEMRKEIASLTETLEVMPNSSIKMTQQRNLLKTKLEYQLFDKFKDGYVTIADHDYPVAIYQLKGDAVPYCCDMEVKI